MSLAKQKLSMLLERNGLPPSHVYLLNLIPLIDMVWADGKNQRSELFIVDQYLKDHIKRVNASAEGLEVITFTDYQTFKAYFLERRPARVVLDTLHEICEDHVIESGDNAAQEWEELINSCMDIAAACVTEYPFQLKERVCDEEKKRLKMLIRRLQFSKSE